MDTDKEYGEVNDEIEVIVHSLSGENADDDAEDIEIKEKPGRRRKARKVKEVEEKPVSAVREVLSMLLYVVVVLVLTFVVVQYVGQRTQVKGTSMEDTLHDKDNLIVDKITYRFKEPERFDIIVFPYLYKEKTYYIKRIIGLPGETVQIIGDEIFIDGLLLEENYGREAMSSAGIAEELIQLEDDEYFVLGDNRNYSADSRESTVGNIKREDIMGRAWLRIWPLEDFGILRHQ